MCIAAAAVGFTLTLQIALNANFAVEEMHMIGLQQGLLEMFRESCGIFALGILALLAGLAEPIIGAVVLVFLAVGLASYCFVHELLLADHRKSRLESGSSRLDAAAQFDGPCPCRTGQGQGRRIGQIQAAGAAGSGLGLVLALILNSRRADPAFVYRRRLGRTGCVGGVSVYPAPDPKRKTQACHQRQVRPLLSAQFPRRLAKADIPGLCGVSAGQSVRHCPLDDADHVDRRAGGRLVQLPRGRPAHRPQSANARFWCFIIPL